MSIWNVLKASNEEDPWPLEF